MYSIFFYFSNTELKNLIYFLDVINSEFAKIFHTPYEGLLIDNLEEILQKKDENMIYGIPKIHNLGPYHDVQFWEDSFSISVELYGDYLLDMNSDFFQKIQLFTRKIIEKIPVLAMNTGDGDEAFENGWHVFREINIEEYIDFGYFKGNFIVGKSNFSEYYKE